MKIRGNTVGTTLRPEVILTKATALTEEQKAKARENIGAASIADIKENVDLSNFYTKDEALYLFATDDYVNNELESVCQILEELREKPHLSEEDVQTMIDEATANLPSGEVPPTDELVQAVIDALPVYDGSYSDLVEEYDGTIIIT